MKLTRTHDSFLMHTGQMVWLQYTKRDDPALRKVGKIMGGTVYLNDFEYGTVDLVDIQFTNAVVLLCHPETGQYACDAVLGDIELIQA